MNDAKLAHANHDRQRSERDSLISGVRRRDGWLSCSRRRYLLSPKLEHSILYYYSILYLLARSTPYSYEDQICVHARNPQLHRLEWPRGIPPPGSLLQHRETTWPDLKLPVSNDPSGSLLQVTIQSSQRRSLHPPTTSKSYCESAHRFCHVSRGKHWPV